MSIVRKGSALVTAGQVKYHAVKPLLLFVEEVGKYVMIMAAIIRIS